MSVARPGPIRIEPESSTRSGSSSVHVQGGYSTKTAGQTSCKCLSGCIIISYSCLRGLILILVEEVINVISANYANCFSNKQVYLAMKNDETLISNK